MLGQGFLPPEIRLFHVKFIEGYERTILLAVGGREPPQVAIFKSYEAAMSFCKQLDFEIPEEPPLHSKEEFFKELKALSKKDPRVAELNLFTLIPHLLEAEYLKRNQENQPKE